MKKLAIILAIFLCSCSMNIVPSKVKPAPKSHKKEVTAILIGAFIGFSFVAVTYRGH